MDSIAMMFKERMANMPDDITDKDILAYAKNIIKEIKEENKKKKAEDAALNKKKRVVKKQAVKVDEEGNVVPKKPNMYQQYIKDNQQRVKEQYPELTNTERFAKLAEEWNEYKKTIVAVVESPKEKGSDNEDVVESPKEKDSDNEEIVESPKKEKAPKKINKKKA